MRTGQAPLLKTLGPPRVDIVIAAVFLALALVEAPFGSPPATAWHTVAAALAMGLLAWRRRFPVAVALVELLVNGFVNPQDQYSLIFAVAVSCFTIGEQVSPPRTYLGIALVTLPFLAQAVVRVLQPGDLGAALVFMVGPWVIGTVARQQRISAREAAARADRLEDEAALRADLAVQQERVRIARELHDVVSHSISVVTISTQAVRHRLLPDQTREADELMAVEQTAREAMVELRRLFGVLRARDEAPELMPQPGLSDLERLLEQARAGGLEVRQHVGGTPYPLPPGVDLAAYRIVQEGLTNVLRHARARSAQVALEYTASWIEVVVSDDGVGVADHRNGGHGLVGIRERATMYGGQMVLTPLASGGTRLAVRLATEAAR